MELDWFYVIFFLLLHIGAVYGLWIPKKSYWTYFYCKSCFKSYKELYKIILLPKLVYVSAYIISFGITAGAHRLFAHKSYKANAQLRILLIFMHTLSLQRSIYTWVRDHRLHHKYTDTNADPHNSRRGFFFAHIGWLLVKPHPDVIKFNKFIDKSDLKADPYVMFQHRNHNLCVVLTVLISTLTPWFLVGESLEVSFFFTFILRYAYSLHRTWLVNSAAHFYGTKPYDVNISSNENKLVSFYAVGEGIS